MGGAGRRGDAPSESRDSASVHQLGLGGLASSPNEATRSLASWAPIRSTAPRQSETLVSKNRARSSMKSVVMKKTPLVRYF